MGKQRGWSFEDLKSGFEQFYKVHKRYPTSRETDNFEFLPTSRSIQRRFGGLVETRKVLNLKRCHSREYGNPGILLNILIQTVCRIWIPDQARDEIFSITIVWSYYCSCRAKKRSRRSRKPTPQRRKGCGGRSIGSELV